MIDHESSCPALQAWDIPSACNCKGKIMIDTRKDDFINDYVDDALESPHDHRNPDEIFSDAMVEWEESENQRADTLRQHMEMT